MDIVEIERDKYTELWRDVPDYKNYSPGLENVARFLNIVDPFPLAFIADIGCGTGAAGLEFAKAGLEVHWIDITDAGLRPDVPRDRFIQMPLWGSWKHGFDYGFCCDVMEHIPTEYVMLTLDRIVSVCSISWFQINFLPDGFGEQIGQSLHLTVRPFTWWLERLRSLNGEVVDARDLCGQGMYIVRRK